MVRRGSFSCIFKNKPTVHQVETHLRANGFALVSSDVKENVLQVHFYAYGPDECCFLSEFVFVFSRRFFQATFKCQVRPNRTAGCR